VVENGPLVFLDYIRHYGDEQIGGLQFVGGVTKLGSPEAMSVLTPEFLDVVPQFLSTDAETAARGLEGLLQLCFVRKPSPSEFYLMLGYNLSVRPYVRQGMFSRSFHNDDLLPKIRKPVLITHGTADAIVKPAAVEQHKAAMRHAQVQLVPNVGHGVFWDDTAGFNNRPERSRLGLASSDSGQMTGNSDVTRLGKVCRPLVLNRSNAVLAANECAWSLRRLTNYPATTALLGPRLRDFYRAWSPTTCM
jgi:hypothetical protein